MIFLYNPWSTHSPRKPLPIALLSLGAVLGEESWELVDGNLETDPVRRMVELAAGRRPELIGVTVMAGPQLGHAVRDTRRLKAAFPDTPIVWGGYFPSQHADAVLTDPAIDYCVLGQGEHTLRDLLGVLRRGGDLASVQGLIFREGDRVRRAPRRPLVPLDELPDLPYERVPIESYLQSHYLGRRVAAHHSSYGCPFGCSFCAVVQLVQRRWVAQSPARVERAARYFVEQHGADALQFYDMDFFISEPRVAEISERIEPLGLSWWALGRVDELMRYREETWQRMAASGLKMVFVGAETASDETLERMNKGGKVSADLTRELVRRMKAYGIVPELSFVVGSPPEPAVDLARTIEFVRELKTIHPATEVILYTYTPVPQDGALFAEAQARGFEFPQTLDDWVDGRWAQFSLRRDPKTPWLDPAIKRRVREFERVLNAYYPTVTDQRLTGLRRSVLRGLGAWRYHTRFYAGSYELRLVQKLFRYQRPETTGF